MSKSAPTYEEVICRVESMVGDRKVERLANRYGLQVLNVTWEDTARYKNSCVGPNISDMTIQVQTRLPGSHEYQLTCMPVIRFPNFADVSADIAPDNFLVRVGNEHGQPLRPITLRQLLGDLPSYLHEPQSWLSDRTSLLAERDTHVLVSAQACFLPIPQSGIAEFNPVLFNYQSTEGDPAVLAILATREGTSITVIDNQRDAFAAGENWGQRLFFNQNGERCSLTGQRQSDFLAANPKPEGGSPVAGTSGTGLNLVLLIQVPLKQKNPMQDWPCGGGTEFDLCLSCDASDVEEAVIGHGKVEGPFTEIDGLAIERDDRYPIRVTVQFYKATSNGVLNEEDMAAIAGQIKRVYQEAEYVGSLVVQGPTGRPTEHAGLKVEPPGWWDAFWRRHFANLGQTRDQALQMLRRLLG